MYCSADFSVGRNRRPPPPLQDLYRLCFFYSVLNQNAFANGFRNAFLDCSMIEHLRITLRATSASQKYTELEACFDQLPASVVYDCSHTFIVKDDHCACECTNVVYSSELCEDCTVSEWNFLWNWLCVNQIHLTTDKGSRQVTFYFIQRILIVSNMDPWQN